MAWLSLTLLQMRKPRLGGDLAMIALGLKPMSLGSQPPLPTTPLHLRAQLAWTLAISAQCGLDPIAPSTCPPVGPGLLCTGGPGQPLPSTEYPSVCPGLADSGPGVASLSLLVPTSSSIPCSPWLPPPPPAPRPPGLVATVNLSASLMISLLGSHEPLSAHSVGSLLLCKAP